MIHFKHLHHVSLIVRDLEKARVFYTDILHFPELVRPPFDTKGIWYAVGEQQLHLLENSEGETLRSSNKNALDGHFAIWVESYSQTIAFLEERGIPYEANPKSLAGFSQIFILDPDNNIIEFDTPYETTDTLA